VPKSDGNLFGSSCEQAVEGRHTYFSWWPGVDDCSWESEYSVTWGPWHWASSTLCWVFLEEYSEWAHLQYRLLHQEADERDLKFFKHWNSRALFNTSRWKWPDWKPLSNNEDQDSWLWLDVSTLQAPVRPSPRLWYPRESNSQVRGWSPDPGIWRKQK